MTDISKMNTLGSRLRYLRELHGYSLRDVEELIDEVAHSSLSLYERDIVIPNALVIKKLIELYGCSSDWLLGIEKGKGKKQP